MISTYSLLSRDSTEDDRKRRRRNQEEEDPINKRRKTEREERNSSRSSEDSKSGKRPWTFRHTKEGAIIDDEVGLSQLFRHFKPITWDFPPFKEMAGKDDYTRTCSLFGQAFSQMNKTIIHYEEALAKAPSEKVLEQVEGSCRDAQGRYEEAKAKVDALEKQLVSQREDIMLLEKENKDLKVEQELADSRSLKLVNEKNEFKEQVLELTSQIEVEKRRAKRAGKKDMIEAYKSVLEVIQAKFVKMKSAERSLIKAQEVKANIDLLEEIIEGKIQDLLAEKERLSSKELPRRKAKLLKRAVSDFSLSKLALPQVSEGSNEAMGVNEGTGAPQELKQQGEGIQEPEGAKDTEVLEEGGDEEEDPKDEGDVSGAAHGGA